MSKDSKFDIKSVNDAINVLTKEFASAGALSGSQVILPEGVSSEEEAVALNVEVECVVYIRGPYNSVAKAIDSVGDIADTILDDINTPKAPLH